MKTTLLVLLGALVLALYLWTALQAPVVLWSDSRTDLAWAKEGLGTFKPIPPPAPGKPIDHLPKPGYLLFLRGAMLAFPSLGEERSVIVVQSALLALSILGTALFLARRRGFATGAVAMLVCLIFLRLRDASSAVMTEALAAAILLPIAAAILEPARRTSGILTGLACGALFLVRPNCGGIVLAIAVIVFAAARETRRLVFLLGGFAVLILPFWYLGRGNLPGDPLHGLGYQIVEGSAEYYWAPSITPWPVGETPGEAAAEDLRVARKNWKNTLSAAGGTDTRRELAWRGFHGLLGIEFYDSRWSPEYESADNASRLVSPFLILAAAAALLAAPWRDGRAKLAGLALLAGCVAQNLLLGSNPRYALPLLPVLFLLAAAALPRLGRGATWAHRLGAVLCLAGLIGAAAWQPHLLDWQWAKIESAGVTIHQAIPKGGLPAGGPATLHVRIAPALASSSAQLDVIGPGQRLLYSSDRDASRQRPLLTIPLPAEVLDANQTDRIFLALRTRGSYSETSYLLFPVIPQPWGRPALREKSESISPATGIRRGALDWWAHPGAD